jgi:hypothetical protein
MLFRAFHDPATIYWTACPRHDLLTGGGNFQFRRGKVMNNRIFLAVLGCTLVAAPAMADTRQDVMAAMQRCSVMQDDRTWLECTYGAQQIMRAKLGLPPAPDYQQRLVPPAASPAATVARAPAASGTPLSTPATGTLVSSAPPIHRRGGFLQILGGNATPVAVSPLASVEYDGQGAFILTLENGQVWRQLDAEDSPKAHFQIGAKITVTPGALWTYNLKTAGNAHSYKVERRS